MIAGAARWRYEGQVAWAWALVAVIGAGLPVTAWWLSRRARPVPALGRPPRWAGPDRWLFERYGLGVLERWHIREAVFVAGRPPDDPGLREPARALAREVVNGRVPPPRATTALGWVCLVIGVALAASGLVARSVFHRHGELPALGAGYGAAALILGVFMLVLVPVQIRQKAAEALAHMDEPGGHQGPGAPGR